jgi:hypothetical protein
MFLFLDRYFDRLFTLLAVGTLRTREQFADPQAKKRR